MGPGLAGIKTGPGKSLREAGDIVAQAFGCEREYRRECGFKP